MLNWGLRKFDTIEITRKDKIFDNFSVWLGKKKKLQVISKKDFYLTVR